MIPAAAVKGPNYIALAVPFFFLLIGLELLWARARRRRVYRLADAVADLGCGIAQQVVVAFAGAALLAAYAAVHDRYRVLTLPVASPWAWLAAFAGVDLAYYWWHRLSHRVNVLWAVHVVHHQSEDYNLAVALRQAILSGFTSLPFYVPLALLGVPTLAYATMLSLSTLYQFWIHTELVGKLGRAEAVLNTPSHHRVHHAVNPRYLDRNYGATFIVWDRLFGTFAEEREPAVFGIVKPLGSFNPMWAQVEYWVQLWRKAHALPRRSDRIKVWFMPPDWKPAGAAWPEPPVEGRRKHEAPVGRGERVYAGLQLVPVVAATFALMMWGAGMPRATALVLAGLVLWSLASLGGLLDGRRWARPLEAGRLLAVVAAVLAIAVA